jgi:AAA+ superfamily predicted ATPase
MTSPRSIPWHEANLLYLKEEMERLRAALGREIRRRQGTPAAPASQFPGLVITDAAVERILNKRAEHAPDDRNAIDSAAPRAKNLERLRRSLADTGVVAPADAMTELFGLTAFERDVILLALAPELDPEFETLYAYLHNDGAAKYASPHLALSVLTGPDGWLTARDSFLPTAPVRRYRLVHLAEDARGSGALLTRPLRLDERITDYLLGVDRIDETAAAIMTPVREALVAPTHVGRLDALARWASPGSESGRHRILNLTGPAGAGKRAFARALCTRLGLGLYELLLKPLEAGGAESRDLVRLVEREALLSGCALYVDLTRGDESQASATLASLRDFLSSVQPLLILGTRHPVDVDVELLSVPLAKPDREAQRQMWKQALPGAGTELHDCISAIVEQFDFGPRDIATTAARAAARLGAFNGTAGSEREELWQASREQAGHGLEELAQRIRPCYAWDDIVLPDDVTQQLREMARQVEYRALVYEDWGFGAKLSRGRGIGALFSGPSGTGKTMAAEVLANHLKLDLYRVDLASTVSKYVGETEKNLAKIFDAAERSGAILFFDEADALFSKRVEVRDGHDRYANIETNYLLQRMEDYRGLAILATNRKANLDDAFMRRLRFLVDFPAPNAALRQQIWQRCFPPSARVALDFAFLSRLDIPGGNIRNISLNAAFLAAPEGEPISLHHVLHAARREYAKIDKLVVESEFGPFFHQVRR